MTLHEHVCSLVERLKEWYGLNSWEMRVDSGPMEDATASCSAWPEYKRAVLTFDFDKMETGVDVQEIVAHEMAHCHTWELHTLAEELAQALAESAPESHREPLGKLLSEKVRQAGERCTTEIGFTYLRLAREAKVLDSPAVTE